MSSNSMHDEQTNTTDTDGETGDRSLAADGEPLSDYDKALALVKRREEATKAENEVLERKEKLAANAMLGGTSGGHVKAEPPKEISDVDYAKAVLEGKIGDEKEKS